MSLLERLRDMADPKRVGSHFHPLYGEAADEIERLNGIVLNAAHLVKNIGEAADEMRTERDEARALGRSA